jgi:hypothetical protein
VGPGLCFADGQLHRSFARATRLRTTEHFQTSMRARASYSISIFHRPVHLASMLIGEIPDMAGAGGGDTSFDGSIHFFA